MSAYYGNGQYGNNPQYGHYPSTNNNHYGYGEEMVEFDVLDHDHGYTNDHQYMNNISMNDMNGYDPPERQQMRSPPKPIRPGLSPTEDMGSPGWPLAAPNRRINDRRVDSFASVSSTPVGSRSGTPAFVRFPVTLSFPPPLSFSLSFPLSRSSVQL